MPLYSSVFFARGIPGLIAGYFYCCCRCSSRQCSQLWIQMVIIFSTHKSSPIWLRRRAVASPIRNCELLLPCWTHRFTQSTVSAAAMSSDCNCCLSPDTYTICCICFSELLCRSLNTAHPGSVDPELGLNLEAFSRVYFELKLGDVSIDFAALGLSA